MQGADRTQAQRVQMEFSGAHLEGELTNPPEAGGVILFPHGRGTSRGTNDFSLASRLQAAGFGTLLLNLSTAQEAELDTRIAAFRFDVGLLADRLVEAARWLAAQPSAKGLTLGYVGVGYGASAALLAAARSPVLTRAVVAVDA